jgi:hypothetical protein
MASINSAVVLPSAFSRRAALGRFGWLAAGLAVSGCSASSPPMEQKVNANEAKGPPGGVDDKILNFALNLEFMEAEYYTRGAYGHGLNEHGVDVGRNAGSVNGGQKVNFSKQAHQDHAEELSFNEVAHVKFYRKTLGSKAADRPQIDFVGGFNAAAAAAGLVKEGETFDPFADEFNFFLGGMLFEDVGVTAYHGAAPLLTNKDFLAAAAGILAVEAYHMGMVRKLLYDAGEKYRSEANAISKARDTIDGHKGLDQGIEVNGKANIVPNDDNGIAFARTPRQVLNIVYLKPGASKGGFYPNGFSGDFTGLL